MWIPETVLIIIIFIIGFFLEKFRTERNKAESENADLRRRLTERDMLAKEAREASYKKEKSMLKDSFLLLCSLVEHQIPNGYTIKEIADIFVDWAHTMSVYSAKDMEAKKLQFYIKNCVRHSEDAKAIEKCLANKGLKFNDEYVFNFVFVDVLPLNSRDEEHVKIVVNEVCSRLPQAFLPLSNAHNSQC